MILEPYIRLKIEIEIELEFKQSEEKRPITSLVNFAFIGQDPIRSRSRSVVRLRALEVTCTCIFSDIFII